MSYSLPGPHPNQKPTRSPQIDWRHPLARQLAAAWLIPDVLRTGSGDGADAWHYRIANGVDDTYARIEGTNYFAPGPRGTVLRFFGSASPGSAAYVLNSPTITYSNQMSLFVRARVPSAGFRWLVSRVGGSWLGISSGSKLVWTTLAGTDKLGATSIADGNWHTLGMTLAGTTLKLWVDGALDGTYTGVVNSVNTGDMFWGHRGDWVEFFDGEMEWVNLWKRPLDAAEVADLHTNPFGLYATDPLARFYISTINLAATGARVTELSMEVAVPGAMHPTAALATQLSLEVATQASPTSGSGPTGLDPNAVQFLTYQAGLDRGPLQWLGYQSFIGASQHQNLTYDLVTNVLSGQLIEDGDGVPPSGSATFDTTPTIRWNNPQPGSNLFVWAVSGQVTLSGTTLALLQTELPALAPGNYLFLNTAYLAVGGTVTMTPLSFSVLPRRGVLAPKVVALDPFELEPVLPEETDYVRYLPQWMALHAATRRGDSLLMDLFRSPLAAFRAVSKAVRDQRAAAALGAVPGDLPRLGWTLQTRFTDRDPVTITVSTSGLSGTVRRAGTLYQFLTADDPIFLIEPDGVAWFRNLCQRQVLATAVATGGVLASQYQINDEVSGFVPDADLFFQPAGGVWTRIRAGSAGVDAAQATVQLPPGTAGPVLFRFLSQQLLPGLTVSLSGSPGRAPDRVDLWNRFDELALLAGLTRRPGEDNLALKARVSSRFLSRPGTTLPAVAQHIAQDLALTQVLAWDGRTALNFPVSGLFGVRAVDVPGLAEWHTVTEELTPWDGTRFTSSKSDWLPGWQLWVDGRPAQRAGYPALALSGNVVSFGTSVSGRVTASYRYRNYTAITTDAGFLSGLVPVAANLPSGSYQCVLTQNVRAFAATNPYYQRTALLNGDGTATGLFRELRERLLDGSPVHLQRARWGRESYWLTETDTQPAIEHLPLPFDQHL